MNNIYLAGTFVSLISYSSPILAGFSLLDFMGKVGDFFLLHRESVIIYLAQLLDLPSWTLPW